MSPPGASPTPSPAPMRCWPPGTRTATGATGAAHSLLEAGDLLRTVRVNQREGPPNQCQLVAEDTMRWKRGVHRTEATTQYRKYDLDAGEFALTVYSAHDD